MRGLTKIKQKVKKIPLPAIVTSPVVAPAIAALIVLALVTPVTLAALLAALLAVFLALVIILCIIMDRTALDKRFELTVRHVCTCHVTRHASVQVCIAAILCALVEIVDFEVGCTECFVSSCKDSLYQAANDCEQDCS